MGRKSVRIWYIGEAKLPSGERGDAKNRDPPKRQGLKNCLVELAKNRAPPKRQGLKIDGPKKCQNLVFWRSHASQRGAWRRKK